MSERIRLSTRSRRRNHGARGCDRKAVAACGIVKFRYVAPLLHLAPSLDAAAQRQPRIDQRGSPYRRNLPRRRGRRGTAIAGRTDSSPLVYAVAKIPVARGIEGNLARRTGAGRRSWGGAVREQLVSITGSIRRLDLVISDIPALPRGVTERRERLKLPDLA